MIDYINGVIKKVTPTYLIIETGGIGYLVYISLTTFSLIEKKSEYKILIHEVIREDAHQLFGFAGHEERDIFRLLISVNGVGANTARMMLSSLSPAEIVNAISLSEVNVLKGIKGIGLKTAQRIIVELKDKIGSHAGGEQIFALTDNTIHEEALSALVMLGFAKSAVTKVLDKIIREEKNLTVEDLIKKALKNL
jgi:Holliday junction DNA helicase RuvA